MNGIVVYEAFVTSDVYVTSVMMVFVVVMDEAFVTSDVYVTSVINEAFVTLVTSDIYALGALVLSSSLRRSHTTRQLVVMLTTGVSQPIRLDKQLPYNITDSEFMMSFFVILFLRYLCLR